MIALAGLYNNVVQPVVSKVLGGGSSASGVVASSPAPGQDSKQLSPFGQILSRLQQLQQESPAHYQQATKKIANALQTAALTAQKAGNTTSASKLTTLSNDFSFASTNNQLPNVQNLLAALGGGQIQSQLTAYTTQSAVQSQPADPLGVISGALGL